MLPSSRIIPSNASRIASIARQAILAPAHNRRFHVSRPAMTVHVVKTADEFRQAIANNKVVIVDSYADWCPPCKAIAPVLEKHSNSDEFKDKVHFVKFDVDKIPEISQELRVSSIPAFFFFKDGKQVDSFVGANPAELQRLLKTHSA
ncbi:Thioredoxin-1 [Beauveria bassiana D1-5]|uniref:Thioredoxin-1 n=1 Tax=Beauveria bassiana D1-5 TaxID=1245745 RepID=A0A0A2VMI5_BEABA|nr:Thioredoxin-1 [Beauveria bassiana D1-5]